MKKYSYLSTCLLLILLLSTNLQAQVLEGKKAKEIHPTLKKIRLDDDQQVIKFLKFEPDQQPKLTDLPNLIKETLNQNNHKSTNGLTLKKTKDKVDKLGYQQVHFQQYYKEVPVEMAFSGAQVKEGKVQTVMGRLYKNIEVNTTPNFDEKQALNYIQQEFEDAIIATVHKSHKHHNHTHEHSDGKLVVFKHNNQDYLCWKLDVSIKHDAKTFYVNAHNGYIVKTYSLINDCAPASGTTALYGSVDGVNTHETVEYVAGETYTHFTLHNDTCDEVEVHVVNWNNLLGENGEINDVTEYTDSDNNWNNASLSSSAFQTYWIFHNILDFYNDKFSLNSYDGNSASLLIYNEDGTTSSGKWNSLLETLHISPGNDIYSGHDDHNSIDLMGHEFTHGVTKHALNGLTYEGESGALNESFSDILGIVFERWLENNQNPDWLIHEDVFTGPIRNFAFPGDPTLIAQQPSTFEAGPFWKDPLFLDLDKGGVHFNSGVQNFWFYLLTDGDYGVNDNGDAYYVDGIGLDKATDIAYRTLTEKLTDPNSDFLAARLASIEAAEDEYGACSYEVIQVTNAWAAVGVGDISPCPADLIVINPYVTSNPQAGSTINFSSYVQNTGNTETGAHYLYYYLSDDATLSGDDTWIGLDLITDSPVPSQIYNTESYTLPASLTGCHYIHFFADATNNVYEISEANNVTSIEFCITSKPDLIITDLTINGELTTDNTISIDFNVANIGDAATPNTTHLTSIHLSDDFILDPTDTYIGTRATSFLASGAVSPESQNYTIPTNEVGCKFLLLHTDSGNAINEQYESNNIAYKVFCVNGAPDLIVENLQAPATVTAGTPFTISCYVKNIGTASENVSDQLHYYLSSDNVLDSGDTQIGSDVTDYLSDGAQQYESINYTFPNSIIGNYHIIAKTDANNDLAESNENNNVSSIPISILAAQAPTCSTPPNSEISFKRLCNGSLQLYSTANQGLTMQFQYREPGGPLTTSNPTNTNITITDTEFCTLYQVRMRIKCANGVWSSYSAFQSIWTRAPRPLTNETSTSLCGGSQGFLYYWGDVDNDRRFRYREVDANNNDLSGWIGGWLFPDNNTPGSNHYRTITGLSPNSYYQYQVIVKCEDTGFWSCARTKTFQNIPCKTNGDITDLTTKTNFKIYPNPTQHLININIDGEEMAEIIRIYDLQGRLLKEVNSDTHIGGTVQIDISDLQAGMYMVRINDTYIEKITKL